MSAVLSRLEKLHWSVVPLVAALAGAGGVFLLARPFAPQAFAARPQIATVDAAPTGAAGEAKFVAQLPPEATPLIELPAGSKPAALADAPKLSPDDAAAFAEAAGAYRRGQFALGDAAAARVGDPIARVGLDWMALRVNATPARLDAFAAAHPEWPAGEWMRSVREGWLYSGKPAPAETLAAFAGSAPVTVAGRIAMARALLASGKSEEAQATVRALWRDGDLDGVQELAVTREFGAMLTREDHRARADRLLYLERGSAAWRAAALAGPDVMALATARIEAARGPLAARTAAAVPPALRSDPGFVFAHVQDARRSGRLEEAESWLQLAPKEPAKLVDPDKWWSERRMIARSLIDRGQYDKAYAVAAGAVARSSPARVDAAFHAGWIALRFLKDPALAAPHFAAAVAAAETPISIARALYWRGRAAEAQGLDADARGFYAKAAAYPVAYYGQLAARKLGGVENIALRNQPAPATGDSRAEATRVVELYLSQDLEDYVAPIAYSAAKTWTDAAQLAALSEVLRAKASAATNVIFGKLALERGFALDATAFPTFGLPSYDPLAGSAGLAQVMAVARQESEFLVRAASGAGAKGLMQILPGTAADTARKAGVPYDYGRLIGDPAYNMQLGAAYLGQLVAAEGGSIEMALAAYNAGAGRVAQWVNAYGDPRNGADLVDWVERIPFDETRDYVERVMENYAVYQARLAEAPEPRALAGAMAKR
jgi:soluble lytic murein transglycosylase